MGAPSRASLCHEVLERYDAALAEEHDLEHRLYFSASRAKFITILGSAPFEDAETILEVGTSAFSAILKVCRPLKRIVTLNLAYERPRWYGDAEVEHVVGDLTQPPLALEDGAFDLIVFSEVLEHLQGNPHHAFGELLRALRPGGRMVLTTPNLARLASRLRLALGRTPLETVGPPGWGGHFREYTLHEVRALAVSAGFRVERAEHALYWDDPQVYLHSGPRWRDAHGAFHYRPRFHDPWRKLVGPLVRLYHLGLAAAPSLRGGLVLVASRPSDAEGGL